MTAEQAIRRLLERVVAVEEKLAAIEQKIGQAFVDDLTQEIGDIPGLGSAGAGGEPETQSARTETASGASAPKARIDLGGGQYEYAPATHDQRELREQMLQALGFENLPKEHNLEKASADRAYVKGGPLWLYDFDRDYVMSLPPSTRAAMVQDVNMIDPEEAALLSRDILKVQEREELLGPEEFIDRDRQYRAAHGGSTGARA